MQAATKLRIRKSLMMITAAGFLMSIGLLGYYVSRYSEADKVQRQVLDTADPVYKTIQDTTRLDTVDHAALLAANPDYVGWLTVEGTTISYPVVYSQKENQYLHRDYYGQKSIAGTVFMDVRNNPLFSDTNTMLYGHNMRNGTMFADVRKFLNKDFFDRHQTIEVITPHAAFEYEIFAVYRLRTSAIMVRPGMLTEDGAREYLHFIQTKALHQREITVLPEDRMLTLSTCGNASAETRVLVHAKRIAVTE